LALLGIAQICFAQCKCAQRNKQLKFHGGILNVGEKLKILTLDGGAESQRLPVNCHLKLVPTATHSRDALFFQFKFML
jgi:hypothetical protein